MFKAAYSKLLGILILTALFFIIAHSVIHSTLLAQTGFSGDVIEEFISGRKNELKIGLRVQSYPISFVDPNSVSPTSRAYNGFCNTFADQLFADLKDYLKQELWRRNPNPSNTEIDDKVNAISLTKTDVVNLSQGKRFDGVIKGLIDVECGANSIQYNTEVEFSDPFFSTGISLLAKKDNLDKVLQNEEGLGNLRIGVVSGTTTSDWLVKDKRYENFVPYQSRPEAISALKSDPLGAYASDYIILKGILEQDSDLKGNYDVYPKYLKDQNYGLVVKARQSKLKELIDKKTLKSTNILNKIQFLKNNYSKPESPRVEGGRDSGLDSSINFIRKLFSSPLNSFLLGIAISILILMLSFKKTRQLIAEILTKLWEQVIPDVVRCLYRLLQLIVRPRG
jgi:ABC-type amino acid transport substrate-binding protein